MNFKHLFILAPVGFILLGGAIYWNSKSELETIDDFPGSELVTPMPSTVVHQEPRRKDDVAWENDKIAFRIYGPGLKDSFEDSGIDLWIKRVDYPIVKSWYDLALNNIRSYHEDNGEGYDGYIVGNSSGCGGSGLWVDGHKISSNVYTDFTVVKESREQTVFLLFYEYPNGIHEKKQISILLGDSFMRMKSFFTRDGKPVADLPIVLGLAKQTDQAFAETDLKEQLIQLREHIREDHLRTFIYLDQNNKVNDFKEVAESSQPELLMITSTDRMGVVEYKVGYELE